MTVPALVLHPEDNVATAVQPLDSGARVVLAISGKPEAFVLRQPVPFGHKFATRDIHPGDVITKYGETIGKATADILPGEHVHLHNVEGTRGRGDRQ